MGPTLADPWTTCTGDRRDEDQGPGRGDGAGGADPADARGGGPARPRTAVGAHLQTVDSAPVNDLDFSGGYTIEAYVRLPEDCCGGDRAWMGFMGELASGAGEGKTGGYDPLASTATFGFSPSRQVQWGMYPTNRDDTVTSWSHELPSQVWRHAAIVNDGARTEVCVDGALIGRNPAVDAVGIAAHPIAPTPPETP